MSLQSFNEIAEGFPEPWKTLIKKTGEFLDEDSFSNFVILGKLPGDEESNLNACSIVGLSPEYDAFLECHFVVGEEKDKPFWIAELRDVLPALSRPKSTDERIGFLANTIHLNLGLNKCHVLGMISLHQTIKSRHSFAVLWQNPKIKRSYVEEILNYVLDERLKT